MAEQPFEIQTAQVNGARLAYVERGEGEPVVLVHGTVSDLRTWDDLVPRLATFHRAIAYSRRYAPPNPDIPDDLDDQMLPHVDDLVALLPALGHSSAHLVGSSWGAFICLLAAIRYTELVRSLVLMEPPVVSLFVSTPPRPQELLRTFLQHPRIGWSLLRFGMQALSPAARAFGEGVMGKGRYAELSKARRQQMRDNVRTARAQLLGAGFPPLRDSEVRALETPTLLLQGDSSPMLLRRLSDRLAELIPDAERGTITDASHNMHEDQPDQIAAAILTFLRGRAGSPLR